MDNHFESVINLRTGKPVEGASIAVQTEAGAIATIYSDNGTTALDNPFTTDAKGFYNFYAADGRYTVTISGPGIDSRSYSVLLEDPSTGTTTPADDSVTELKLSASLARTISKVVDSVAELREVDKSRYAAVFVTGYYSKGDGGGGAYYLDAADTASADNGGSVIVGADGGRWKIVFNGEYWVEQFGAKGGADSTTAFQKAAATGKPLRVGNGDFTISAPVTLNATLRGSGPDDGQTTFTLTGTGQFVLGDWHAGMSDFFIRSEVNSLTFIKCPGMSFFICKNFRAEKIGSAFGQVAIEFDTTTASIYFCDIDNFKIKLDYPFRVTGNSTQVFNANRLGGSTGSAYYQNFASAITFDGVLASDTNHIAGYFEVGTNIISHAAGALRQNRFHLVNDAVTRTFNGGVAVTDVNVWELLDGGQFTYAGTYPQSQIFIGPPSTKVRATDTSAQSIPNASPTKITFNSEQFDELGEFANETGEFTPKNSDYYVVNAAALSATVAWPIGSRWELRFYKNGVEYSKGDWSLSDAAVTGQRSARGSTLVYLTPSDALDVRVIHNQGGPVALEGSDSGNYIEITRAP